MLVEHASVYNFARYTVRSESSKTAELVLVGSEDPCVHGFDLLTGTEVLLSFSLSLSYFACVEKWRFVPDQTADLKTCSDCERHTRHESG
jgi:hypothetical protein